MCEIWRHINLSALQNGTKPKYRRQFQRGGSVFKNLLILFIVGITPCSKASVVFSLHGWSRNPTQQQPWPNFHAYAMWLGSFKAHLLPIYVKWNVSGSIHCVCGCNPNWSRFLVQKERGLICALFACWTRALPSFFSRDYPHSRVIE